MQDPKLRARSPRSGCTEIPQVPDSGGGVLRVAEDLEIEAALLFRSQRRRGVRVRRNLGSLDNASGNAVETCSILTTTPNAVTAASTTVCLSCLISIPTIC